MDIKNINDIEPALLDQIYIDALSTFKEEFTKLTKELNDLKQNQPSVIITYKDDTTNQYPISEPVSTPNIWNSNRVKSIDFNFDISTISTWLEIMNKFESKNDYKPFL